MMTIQAGDARCVIIIALNAPKRDRISGAINVIEINNFFNTSN